MKLLGKPLFSIAGAVNITAVLAGTQFFTSGMLSKADPSLFSPFGLAMVIVWGLAYMAMASSYQKAPSMVLVFALEKACYGVYGISWVYRNAEILSQVKAESILSWLFLSGYGPLDLIFTVLFLLVWGRIKA